MVIKIQSPIHQDQLALIPDDVDSLQETQTDLQILIHTHKQINGRIKFTTRILYSSESNIPPQKDYNKLL